MIWILYSLLSAFAWASSDAFTKGISNKVDDNLIILSRFLYGAPFVLLTLLFITIPKIDSSFWLVLALILPFEVSAWLLYIKAIRISPLSLVLPFLSLTPIFLVLTSFIILGELPTLIGFFGILLIVVGAYIINIKEGKKDFLGPFKFILKEKGIIYMIFAAFLFSITANFGKILVLKSSPLFFAAIFMPMTAIPLFLIAYFTSRKKLIQIKTNFKGFFFVGLFFALSQIFNFLAVQLIIVPYMISIKRTSSIFGVLYGKFMFKEKNIGERFFGAAIMLIGAALIILG
jgi:drug/metabolite transporter (DMT)-like permease